MPRLGEVELTGSTRRNEWFRLMNSSLRLSVMRTVRTTFPE